MNRSRSYPSKILTRRYSESQLFGNYREQTNSPDLRSMSSSDSDSDSGEVNVLRIDTESSRIRRNRPRVLSAFGRTIKLNASNRISSGNEKKRMPTTEFWNKLPDERFESINRLIRPTVATMCREAYTPIRRFRSPERKMFRSKSDLLPKQEPVSTENLLEPTEALEVTDHDHDFDYQRWLDEVDYNDYAAEDELENEEAEQRIHRQNKEYKKRAKRKKSMADVKNIVNRLYTGTEKNRYRTRTDFNNRVLLSRKRSQSRSESPERRKSLPEKDSNITLSYMWTGKDASSQKLHTCPVAIKSNAKATFDKVSTRFTSVIQY